MMGTRLVATEPSEQITRAARFGYLRTIKARNASGPTDWPLHRRA